MDSSFKEKLKILREYVPIGINGATKLLEKSNGDIHKACDLFKEKAFNIVQQKISFEVDEESIKKNLLIQKYDIEKTLKCLFEQKYSLTERIIMTNKDNEKALGLIMYIIEKENNLTRNFGLDIHEVQTLNTYHRCVVIIMEWVNYENWEGFNYTIAFSDWTKSLIIQLRNVQLDDIADKIQTALSISDEFFSKKRKITENPPIEEFRLFYEQQKFRLFERLIEYIQLNIKEFPQ